MHTLAATGGRICTEHSAFNLETVVGLVAHGVGITPIVRIAGLQYKHVTRYGTDLILLRRGAERAAQTLAPLRKRAAAWAWQSRSENRIRISYISCNGSRWLIAPRSLQRSKAIRNGSKRAETVRKAAPCHIEANTILTPTAFSAARLGRSLKSHGPNQLKCSVPSIPTRRR